jgi:crossover junction endodeoxyribonuclease RuvC
MAKSKFNKPYFIGIDPGKTGAVAVISDDGSFCSLCDFTNHPISFLRKFNKHVSHAYIEKVHAMPKQGVVSTFSFGENFGTWQGILRTLEIPYSLVPPQYWQRELGLVKIDKKDKPSLPMAREMFPDAPLNLKKHHNRSDALLLAYVALQDYKKNQLKNVILTTEDYLNDLV